MHAANWYTNVCKVRHCKPVTNHVNMLTDNELEKLFYYCNNDDVCLTSRSRPGTYKCIVSVALVGKANVLISSQSQV